MLFSSSAPSHRPPARRRIGSEPAHSRSRRAALLIALAVLLPAGLAGAQPASASTQAGGSEDGPSLNYLDAMAHAGDNLHFSPGGLVTVPYRPRRLDSYQVDGGSPVALPAALGASAASTTQPESVQPAVSTGNTSTLRRETYGFLPYWQLGSSLDYDALSTIAYFGVSVNGDGSLTKSGNGWSGWTSSTLTDVINAAHSHGTRVALTIESMAWDSSGASTQSALLGSATARAAAISNIVSEVTNRGVDGVNLDFEPIASGQKANYVTFVRALRAALDAAHPGYELVFCANGSGGSYDLGGLLASGGADAVFIMAYDLRGGNTTATGSIDPLVSNNNYYTLTLVTNYFLTHGASASNTILGLPWEGRAWSVGQGTPVLNAAPASVATYGQGAVGVTYDTSSTMASKDPATTACSTGWPTPCVIGWQYDPVEQTSWTAYYGSYGGPSLTWRELYFDDPRSFGAKCDAVDGWNLRGVGVWALGYDNKGGDGDLTAVLASKFLGVPSTYTPVTPTRLADTRKGLGISSRLTPGAPRQLQVVGAASGLIPAGATAITGTLTVTDQTAGGWIYMGPAAASTPSTSSLNFPAGDVRANGVTVSLASDGSVWVTYVSSTRGASTQVVFDVTGYFMPNLDGYLYKPVAPTRLLDSRINQGLAGAFTNNVPRTLTVVGAAGGLIPADAVAITGNVTVTGQSAKGYLYVGPDPVASPSSSTLNFPTGDNRANNVTVKLGSQASDTGTISITYVAATKGRATTHVIFDVTGYYTSDPTGNAYVPLPPWRALDTRNKTGLSGAFTAGSPRALQVASRGGVPSAAVAVTGNLTVVGQTAQGWLFIGPTATSKPGSSTLNFPVRDVRANGATVAMSGGTVGVTYVAVARASTQVVFDVCGYYIPKPTS